MKITLRTILESITPYEELQSILFPPRASLNINKMARELQREYNDYREVARSIYIKYQTPEDEKGFDIRELDTEVQEAIQKEINELLESEVEIKNLKVPFKVLEENKIMMKPPTIGALEWLFEFEEENEEVMQGEPKPKKSKLKVVK